mmetsp:Transcript_49197/g.158030  ORF Transcript_49197/g.158030 Transcript_49197/m.158030 type:complete len:278 (-) Transcript_49197:262-1095(-)
MEPLHLEEVPAALLAAATEGGVDDAQRHHSEEAKHGCGEANLEDVLDDAVELDEQGRRLVVLLLVVVHRHLDLARDRVRPDRDNQHPAGAAHHVGAGDAEGRLCGLRHRVGLASEGGLVHLDVRAREEDPVTRQRGEAVRVEGDHVSDDDLGVRHLCLLSPPHDDLLVGLVQLRGQRLELPLLDVVGRGGHVYNNEDGEEEGGGLDPGGALVLAKDQLRRQLHRSQHEQHDEHGVVQRVPHQFEVALRLLLAKSIGAEEDLAVIKVGRLAAEARAGA